MNSVVAESENCPPLHLVYDSQSPILAMDQTNENTSSNARDEPVECPPTPEQVDNCPPTPKLKTMDSDQEIASSSIAILSSPGGSERTCSICLESIQKSAESSTDVCDHKFCFQCLKTWSEVKSDCPLCKKAFNKIRYYNNGNGTYEEYKVPERRQNSSSDGTRSLDQRLLVINNSFVLSLMDSMDSALDGEVNVMTTEATRLRYYRENFYSLPRADAQGRFRDATPQFYRENPAQTHRLISFINRELVALLPPRQRFRIQHLLNSALEMLPVHGIRSYEFKNLFQPFLLRHTDHFIHEIYNFARSPYEMETYDQNVRYRIGAPSNIEEVSSDDGLIDSIVHVLNEDNNFSTITTSNTTSRPSRRRPPRRSVITSTIETISSRNNPEESASDHRFVHVPIEGTNAGLRIALINDFQSSNNSSTNTQEQSEGPSRGNYHWLFPLPEVSRNNNRNNDDGEGLLIEVENSNNRVIDLTPSHRTNQSGRESNNLTTSTSTSNSNSTIILVDDADQNDAGPSETAMNRIQDNISLSSTSDYSGVEYVERESVEDIELENWSGEHENTTEDRNQNENIEGNVPEPVAEETVESSQIPNSDIPQEISCNPPDHDSSEILNSSSDTNFNCNQSLISEIVNNINTSTNSASSPTHNNLITSSNSIPNEDPSSSSNTGRIIDSNTLPLETIDSDGSDVQFVLALKPPHLRTPEQVSLNSESDSDVIFVEDSRTKKPELISDSSEDVPLAQLKPEIIKKKENIPSVKPTILKFTRENWKPLKKRKVCEKESSTDTSSTSSSSSYNEAIETRRRRANRLNKRKTKKRKTHKNKFEVKPLNELPSTESVDEAGPSHQNRIPKVKIVIKKHNDEFRLIETRESD